MLVETKAKAGVFSIALGAYLEQFKDLRAEFESQYADFKKSLPDTVEVVDGGLITTKEEAMTAGDKFRAADVDVVFLQMTIKRLIFLPGLEPSMPVAQWVKQLQTLKEQGRDMQ